MVKTAAKRRIQLAKQEVNDELVEARAKFAPKKKRKQSLSSMPKSCQSQGLVPKSKSKGSVESNGVDLNLSQIIVTETGKKFHITCHCWHLEENNTFRALWCPKCVSQTEKVDYTFSTALFCCRSGDSFTLHFDPNCDDTSSPRTLCKTCWKSLLNVAGSSLSGCQLLMLGSPNSIEHLLKHQCECTLGFE